MEIIDVLSGNHTKRVNKLCGQNAKFFKFKVGWIEVTYIRKVKKSFYRSGQDPSVPGGWGSQISKQLAHESDNFVISTHRPPLPQEIFLVLITVRGWVELHGHNAAGRNKWMKISSDIKRNRTHDLPACSAVPQPTAPPCAPPPPPNRIVQLNLLHSSTLLMFCPPNSL